MLRRDRLAMLLDAGTFGMCAMIAMSLGTCLASAGVLSILGGRDPGWVEGAIVVGGCTAVVVVSYLAAAWRFQRLAAGTLAHRLGPANDRVWNLCSKCSYPLTGLPVEGGRVVCPECGESHPWMDGY